MRGIFAIGLLSLLFAYVVVAGAQLMGSCPDRPTQKPLVLKHVAGLAVDPISAVVPNLEVKLQKKRGDIFKDFRFLTTDAEGRFDFGDLPKGDYRLTTNGHGRYAGFCKQSLLIQVTNKGWAAFSMKLPVAVSDSCGKCDAEVAELSK